MLDYEKLDVYRCSLEFLSFALRLATRMPKGYSYLGDQLRRAATAIPLNIAEGTGKVTAPDRAHFHAIARGSAMECGALVDVAGILGLANESEKRDAKDLVVRIVSMLSKMCLYR
ncbi:MAG: four helix bundle protein [Deltaproteobacteria bacterium]|nr:four helix bundle protein [Deltaproteobacteria bacterium]